MAGHISHKLSRRRGGNILLFIVLGLLAVFMVVPLVYVINNAFKPIEELFLFPPKLFVQHPTTDNFIDLFNLLSDSGMPFFRYLFNTLFVTVTGTVVQVILASLCAYSLAKIPFPGAKIVFNMIVLSLMFSPVVTQVPNYIMMVKVGFMDTYMAMLLPAFASSLGLYLIKQFMESTIPDSLLEAARIDGAGETLIFFRVVMPLLKPAWLTLIILSVQSLWNMTSPYTFSETLKTMPQALSQIVAGGIARAGVGSAVSLLMMLLPVLCFVIMQSNIIETMSTSGMKE